MQMMAMFGRATERERIERETDRSAVTAALASQEAARKEVLDKLRATLDPHKRTDLGAELSRLGGLIRAARARVAALDGEGDERRRAEEHAARLKADSLFRDAQEKHMAAVEAERAHEEQRLLVTGQKRDERGMVTPMVPLSADALFEAEERLRDLRRAAIAARTAHAEAVGRLRERDAAEKRGQLERLLAEHAKQLPRARKAIEVALAEIKTLRATFVRAKRFDGPRAGGIQVPAGIVDAALKLWLERTGDDRPTAA